MKLHTHNPQQNLRPEQLQTAEVVAFGEAIKLLQKIGNDK